MDNDSGKFLGGVLALVGVVLGILMATGVISSSSGLVAKILKASGIALIVLGAIIVLIVIAVIVAAIVASKPDPEAEAKMETKRVITTNKQQLAKLKSKATILESELKVVRQKLNDINSKIALNGEYTSLLRNKENLEKTEAEYVNNLNEIYALIDEMDGDISSLESRRSNALAKMKMAEAMQVSSNTTESGAIDDLENRAQYNADYADAMKQLSGKH